MSKISRSFRGKEGVIKRSHGIAIGRFEGTEKDHIFLTLNGHSNLPNPVLIAYLFGKNKIKINIL